MRCVLQRVKSASVSVAGNTVGSIGQGLLIFVGVGKHDTPEDFTWMAQRILTLRMFEDQDGKSNLSIQDIKGELLVVSQFTLYADCRRGTRPSFTESAAPDLAEYFYVKLIEELKNSKLKVATGQFRAMMDVQIHNWGPYTISLESQKQI